ncbi:MAG: Precorrin-6y C5,15-methyltransferase (Decarboxylating), CbiE subunit [Methanomicrobiales archaeon 53_19]|uniref:cobalt-precorrin-7 (C(5))-methyltransferase n=1 Tax=Methanocalculus sp. TaxID=2004547 RepID=UPI0007488AEC|nr:cobalt-precorrin-7 (C(5))-methyltransferase [Methanocalculus sp.]KUK70839.1 MAG: Precorrin-6y C5,15-methyltransferase (Decarboxylating), CbiE subunit [Methanocalculus sp. 52_23]KUL04034.1 MAG: Precorrin-6y C5,15-methyltransferase (Decarboxylating), CbiE subunit [Methanomicrobiales archaeon 53_19]HIJ06778.1 cobalt-precorrin-7 (C(5))-methyltransferase [Methanocalculus sp.]
MKVVGVGCGNGMLTEEGVAAIQGARLIYGSRRAIERVRHHINPGCTVRTITDYKTIQSLPDEAVILSTGDPLLAGLGYLGGEIICGISSLQAAFAAVGLSWSNVSVIDAHGKDHAEAIHDAVTDCRRDRPVFIIAEPKFPVHELAEALRGMDLVIYICQDLGETEERIITGTPENPPVPDSTLFCCIVSPNRTK